MTLSTNSINSIIYTIRDDVWNDVYVRVGCISLGTLTYELYTNMWLILTNSNITKSKI
jgi:hypothetical protein